MRAELGDLVGRPIAPPEQPPAVVAGFHPQRLLAAGGMGRVFLAEQRAPHRLVALKLLESGTPLSVERFRREADLAARLNHPGVATVFAFGVEEGVAYLATELVHGFTLRELLSAADRVSVVRPGEWLAEALRHVAGGAPRRIRASVPGPIETSLEIAIGVARALAHAHERGVVHRDVKPSNIMITFDGDPKLIDFGIAVPVATGEHLTRTGVFVGSHSYAAPEQLRGEHHRVGPWSDTYALAATLFEMLTQRTPFAAPTLVERLSCADARPPVGPRDYNPRVPRALDALVRRGLEPDLERRFQDGDEMAAALRRCPTRRGWMPRVGLRRLTTWVPRTRTQGVALAATAVALIMTYSWLDAVDARDRAAARFAEERAAAGARILALALRQQEPIFLSCVEHAELPPLHPRADRGFAVALTVASGQIVDVRVVSSPVGLPARTRDCLVHGFSQLSLPTLGSPAAVVVEAELELPIAVAERPWPWDD